MTAQGAPGDVERAIRQLVREALAEVLGRGSDELEPLVYTVPELADALGVTPSALLHLVDEGELPIVPHMGDEVLIPRADGLKLGERALDPQRGLAAEGSRPSPPSSGADQGSSGLEGSAGGPDTPVIRHSPAGPLGARSGEHDGGEGS